MWRVESSVRINPRTGKREPAHRVHESGSAREFSIADIELAHRLADLLNADDARRAAERDAS